MDRPNWKSSATLPDATLRLPQPAQDGDGSLLDTEREDMIEITGPQAGADGEDQRIGNRALFEGGGDPFAYLKFGAASQRAQETGECQKLEGEFRAKLRAALRGDNGHNLHRTGFRLLAIDCRHRTILQIVNDHEETAGRFPGHRAGDRTEP